MQIFEEQKTNKPFFVAFSVSCSKSSRATLFSSITFKITFCTF